MCSVSSNILKSVGEVLLLPLPPDAVDEGMVHVKERVAGRGNWVAHLSTDTSVTAIVRPVLNARPSILEGVVFEAFVNVALPAAVASSLVDISGDAVLGIDEAGTDVKGIVGERSILDTASLELEETATTVSTEAVLGVEDICPPEVSNVEGLIPVGLGTGVAALVAKHLFVGVDEEAVEGEEPALYLLER